MKRKIAAFMGVVLATNNTQMLLANPYDMVKQSENNSINEEEIEIPYDESEYQYLTIGDEPFTEELYKYLVKKGKPFAIYDNRLLQETRANERVYLNSSTFPDQKFRTSLCNVLGVLEGDEITEKIQTCTSLTLQYAINTGWEVWENITGLSKFINLKEINFPYTTAYNSTGVGIKDYTELGKMNWLEKAFIYIDQRVDSITIPYSEMNNLKELILHCDKSSFMHSITYNLSKITGLEKLTLTNNLSGGTVVPISNLRGLTNLKYLSIGQSRTAHGATEVSDFEYIKYLTSLEHLDIKEVTNANDLSSIQYLNNLKKLEIPYGYPSTAYYYEYKFDVATLKLPKTKHTIELYLPRNCSDNQDLYNSLKDTYSLYEDSFLSNSAYQYGMYKGGIFYALYGKPLNNITNIIGISKTYDATTEANIEGLSFTGLQNGDTLTKDIDYTINSANFTNVNVGTNKNINVEITLKDTPMTEKYFFTNTNNPRLRTFTISNGVITKADTSINNTSISTILGQRSNVFTFDDTIRIEGTPFAPSVSSGVSIDEGTETIKLYIAGIEVDTKPATLNNKVSFEVNLSSSVLDSLSVGNHEVKLVYSGNSNLNESEVSLGNITINPIPLKATISQTFTYNGSDNFTVSLSNIKKKSNSSTVSGLTGSASITMPNSNVGTYNTFTVNSINLSGTKSSRYTIATNNTDVTGQIVINKKPITISSAVINDKTYDGTTNVNVSSVTFNGLISGQTLQSGIDIGRQVVLMIKM